MAAILISIEIIFLGLIFLCQERKSYHLLNIEKWPKQITYSLLITIFWIILSCFLISPTQGITAIAYGAFYLAIITFYQKQFIYITIASIICTLFFI
jgi:hypothetical protein